MNHTAQHDTTRNNYGCPMHPEVTGKEGDTCPKCGMKLEKINQADITMELKVSPEESEAGKPVQLTLTPRSEKGIVPLDETHEQKLHLVTVSEDLSWFGHIHPQLQPDGRYTVAQTFPAGGNYLLFADYKPQGGSPQTDKLNIRVNGNRPGSSKLETKRVDETGGYTVTVEHADSLATGPVRIPVVIRKDGKVLERSDLQDYLGAVAHIILISVDEKEFLHVHPESTGEYAIYAHAELPRRGMYRMWVQFRTNGVIHTADFTLEVQEAGHHNHVAPAHKH